MKPYYYVYRTSENRGPKIRHATLSLAVTEAERLASQHPGDSFEVLQCVAISRITKPAATFYMDGVQPIPQGCETSKCMSWGKAAHDTDTF